jgi:hypothetical protein
MSGSGHGFLLWLGKADSTGLRKIPDDGKTIFCFSKKFLKSPPTMRTKKHSIGSAEGRELVSR